MKFYKILNIIIFLNFLNNCTQRDFRSVYNNLYDCISPCFSVEPSKGILEEEETMQLTVNFLSEKPGDFEANLLLNYESGINKFMYYAILQY